MKTKRNKFFFNGFSVVELLVVISIISFITLTVLIKYPRISSKQAVDKAARFAAVSIREAQTRAMSIKEGPAGNFPAYGLHFDLLSPKEMALFADSDLNCSLSTPLNCKYEALGDQIVETRQTQSIAQAVELCGNRKFGSGIDCGLQIADIVFLRPTPTVFLQGSVDGINYAEYADIEIIFNAQGSDNALKKVVGITQSGQIFIEDY